MRDFSRLVQRESGVDAPVGWGRFPTAIVALACVAFAAGCGSKDETRTLEPVSVGMTSDMAPIFQDDQQSVYEVKLPVRFPVRAPTAADTASLSGKAQAPYPHYPWFLNSDAQFQISWTLSNLDPTQHTVYILVDPHNEFGVYWPGMAVTNVQQQEQTPNLSGITLLMQVEGNSRRHGTFTVQDMNELAIDFATVMNIILNTPPPDPASGATDNPAVGLVNHAFEKQNRSYNDPMVAGYIPPVIAGLTGIDLGLRTGEPANVAVEIVIEAIDKGSGKIVKRDGTEAILPLSTGYITIGG